MDIFTIYIATFFVIFLVMPAVYFCMKLILWFLLEYCGIRCCSRNQNSTNHRPRRRLIQTYYDRQGNIFTISEGSENNAANRYADFFYLEPNSEEAARIRAQLEKDDKELPSYDDVMRINNITTPTASGAPIGASTTSIATTDTTLTVPPYSEVDPHPPPALPTQTDRDVTAILPNTTTIGTNTQFTCDITNIEPSTSRAAAAAASTSTAITIPIDNPVTNSNV
ncbi:uncharacterized protein LOC119684643 [Teleopsis dalmanni]|uniref:uncharacterized protein LOC119684643 n=1 Tax=Teleopsis dalmanni TaxID=139649 RepID=UPI0018CCF124|nr:uncharacterized protein LOC119684643 [Teleopsis dalmanni]